MAHRVVRLAVASVLLAAAAGATASAQTGPAATVSPSPVATGGQLTVTVTGCIRGNDQEGVNTSFMANTSTGLIAVDDAAIGQADSTGTLERTLTVVSDIGVGEFQIGGVCFDDDASSEPDLPIASPDFLITPPSTATPGGTMTLGSPVVDPGDSTTVLVDGFPARGRVVSLWLDGATLLATLDGGASGPVSATVAIPASTPIGPHRIDAYYPTANGFGVASASITVGPVATTTTSSSTTTTTPIATTTNTAAVTPTTARALAQTGGESLPLAALGLAAAAAALLVRRARSAPAERLDARR